MVLYLALNAGARLRGAPELVGSTTPSRFRTGRSSALRGRGRGVFSVLLGLAFLATVAAFVITGPRVYYSMARDGRELPSIAGRVSEKGQIPTYAMVLQSLCAVAILLVFNFGEPVQIDPVKYLQDKELSYGGS